MTTRQVSAFSVSYAVSLELAKTMKPLSDGEMVKRCAVEMAKAFGDATMAKTVSLSHHIVTQRIFNIQNHVGGKLKQVKHDCSTSHKHWMRAQK